MVCYAIKKEKEIAETINYLLAEGYLHLTDGKYPVVKVTAKCRSCLKRRRKDLDEKDPHSCTYLRGK